MRDGEPIDVNGTTISKEELSAENERCFNSIQEQAKQKILKRIGTKEYVINDSNLRTNLYLVLEILYMAFIMIALRLHTVVF